MDDFQDSIKKWVHLDTKLKKLNDDIKEIRNEKNKMSDSIINFVDDNQLSSSTIKISDGKLKFTETKQTAPITLKFLETCLLESIGDEDKVTQLITYIKERREIKMIPEIKRYYSN
jgi:septal ring factor EnvC (AmiA/AmiB activator)